MPGSRSSECLAAYKLIGTFTTWYGRKRIRKIKAGSLGNRSYSGANAFANFSIGRFFGSAIFIK